MVNGYLIGEICNRNGCAGIINEHYTDKSCACHINPPCSKCTEDRNYCPECGWQGREEQIEYENKMSNKYSDFKSYHEMMNKAEEHQRAIREKMKTGEDINSIDYINIGHTHFSMIKEGVYPKEMSKEELLEKIKGTFGGRFTMLTDHSFRYIAYTD